VLIWTCKRVWLRILNIIAARNDDSIDLIDVDNTKVKIYVVSIEKRPEQRIRDLLSTTIKWSTKICSVMIGYNTSPYNANESTPDVRSVKPDFSTVGVLVCSTILTKLGSFALMSDTSTAAPQVINVAAAIIQRFGSTVSKTERPLAVRRLFMQASALKKVAGWDPNNKNDIYCPLQLSVLVSRNLCPLTRRTGGGGLHPLSLGFSDSNEGGAGNIRSFNVTLTGAILAGTITFRYIQARGFTNWNRGNQYRLIYDGTLYTVTTNPSTITIGSSSANPSISIHFVPSQPPFLSLRPIKSIVTILWCLAVLLGRYTLMLLQVYK
jgi:subtilisin family serine protease